MEDEKQLPKWLLPLAVASDRIILTLILIFIAFALGFILRSGAMQGALP